MSPCKYYSILQYSQRHSLNSTLLYWHTLTHFLVIGSDPILSGLELACAKAQPISSIDQIELSSYFAKLAADFIISAKLIGPVSESTLK